MSRTSVLGGESRSRGLFSGRRTRGVMVARFGACFVVLLLLLFLQWLGLVIGVALLLLVFGSTADTGAGHTVGHWVQDKRRWRHRVRHGLVDFVPVDHRPDDLLPTATGGSRAERREALRAWNTYRDWPDGVDNLYWLESAPGTPAVAYHAGAGETPYLSMAFAVDGPIQGLHGDAFVARAQEAFGQLMAGWGGSQKLVSGIQVVTRVIPADSALHEVWLQDQLDPAAPTELQADYTGLLAQLSSTSFVQRHFVVILWNTDDAFRAAARRHRPGPQGWLDVVTAEGEAARARLVAAMYRNVRALSGPQLAAVLRHLQHPDWPIDRASDVTVDTCWLPSHDERAYTEVIAESPDPLDPDWLLPASTWLHRTAQIPVDALEVRAIDGLWLAPLLTGLQEQIVRTVSTHIAFTPAREAKVVARKDATTDQRDLIEQQRKGRIVDDETELALSAASRRMADLRDGVGHHGAHWAAFLTVSARTHAELVTACAVIEAAAADDAGINRLDWLDTVQSAAQATTWPLGRGMSSPPKSMAARAMRRVGTATAKEPLS
jgi:hypothetical protein